MNRNKIGNINLKNESRQYMHTCCFCAELRICILKIAVLLKKPRKVIFRNY